MDQCALPRAHDKMLQRRDREEVGFANVEFHAMPGGGPERPFPVEHKHGRPKIGDEDRVQLCAQAMCLEEMLGLPAPAGALFYGRTRRRAEVVFDETLRRRTEAVAAEVRAMIDAGV